MNHKVYLNHISTAVPGAEIHGHFLENLDRVFESGDFVRKSRLLNRYCGVKNRHTVLDQPISLEDGDGGFYSKEKWPGTGQRMSVYQDKALNLARSAIDPIFEKVNKEEITHVIISSCTGFYAPGLDLEIVRSYELKPSVERYVIGFMGCFAAINSMKTAYHILRSEPGSKILMINLELCTLHLQAPESEKNLVPFLIFSDGCAASILSSKKSGMEIKGFHNSYLPGAWDHMSWKITDTGYAMHLDKRVPGILKDSLPGVMNSLQIDPTSLEFAIHPGGLGILQAIEAGLNLEKGRKDLVASYNVLKNHGNMSSATVMFVLKDLLEMETGPTNGLALAFGPGLSLEGMLYERL